MKVYIVIRMNKNTNNLKEYIRVQEEGWVGYVHADFKQSPLTALVGPCTTEKSPSSFEKVSSSDTAKVYRYPIKLQKDEIIVYLKKYPHRSFMDGIKHLFRPSRASRAFKAGLMLKEHGLHTPQIVAFLQKKPGLLWKEDILITEEMKNAIALSSVFDQDEINQQPISLQAKWSIIAELGKTVGKMHADGICHGDLRGGNVFVSLAQNKPCFVFIDNERTRRYPVLPAQLRRKNLVQLNMLRANLTLTDRLRFLKTYRIRTGLSKKKAQGLARSVFKATGQRFRRRAKTRTGVDDSNLNHWKFQRSQLGRLDGVFLMDFAKADIALAFLEQIDKFMETGSVLKNDVSTRVVRCHYNGWDIVIKRYNHQGLWHSLRHTLKGSRARKCWRFGHLLAAAKIPSAAPLGMVEERICGVVRQSYIINAFVEGPLLYTVMTSPEYSNSEKQTAQKKAESILEQLGQNRMTHSDMKSVNMLVCNGQPILIDLDSMQHHRFRPYFQLRYDKMLRKFNSRLYGNMK